MFVDKNGKQFAESGGWQEKLTNFLNNRRAVRLTVIIVLAVALVSAVVLWWLLAVNKNAKPAVTKVTRPGGQLPTLGQGGDGNGGDGQLANLKAEELFFGNFYHAPPARPTPLVSGVSLPTNIKERAANYYPFNREIDLTAAVGTVNQQGFAVINNPFAKEADNFLSVYEVLNSRNIPFLITNDFLLYYYHTATKNIFKNIESEVFYQEFWEINKQMFALADQRYCDRYAKVGILNDPILEGLRLEAVYFALPLELMKPKAKQISQVDKDLSGNAQPGEKRRLFSQSEAKYFSFTPPAYLADTIKREMELIELGPKSDRAVRSPALLYLRDYREFSVPKEYVDNAKLNNFYLASRWANSIFPLFYQDEKDCPDCLLDKEDWLVNQTAAHLIARDFSANQELKNRWAKIYKTISFFTDLRSELTYLNYAQDFGEVFSDPVRTVEDVFSNENSSRPADVAALQKKIAAVTFDPAKGGLSRQTDKPDIGMRMLQTTFNPALFVYDQLLYDRVGEHNSYNFRVRDLENITVCQGAQGIAVRCRAFGLDIINAVFDEPIGTSYFVKNTDYRLYGNQAPLVRNHFNGFNNQEWHNNLYWSTLDLVRKTLNTRTITNFPYTLTDAWGEVNLNTALGAMADAQLPLDRWALSIKKANRLSVDENIVKYHYLETNQTLVNELAANTEMLFNVLSGLNLVERNNNEFNVLLTDWYSLQRLIAKETAGEDFNFNDWSFLNELISRYYVVGEGEKTLRLSFTNPANPVPGQAKKLRQTVDGVKLLVSVQHHQDRDILVAGPVFNFKEISD